MFDQALVRFAVSGTLILCLGLADRFLRPHASERDTPPSPAWVRILIAVSLASFYLLIGPTGGALLGGLGNFGGIALAGASIVLRPLAAVRYPELTGRSLFYIALPFAVGVPWGLLALSLPACAASIYCCHRAERMRTIEPDNGVGATLNPRYRMIPGVW